MTAEQATNQADFFENNAFCKILFDTEMTVDEREDAAAEAFKNQVEEYEPFTKYLMSQKDQVISETHELIELIKPDSNAHNKELWAYFTAAGKQIDSCLDSIKGCLNIYGVLLNAARKALPPTEVNDKLAAVIEDVIDTSGKLSQDFCNIRHLESANNAGIEEVLDADGRGAKAAAARAKRGVAVIVDHVQATGRQTLIRTHAASRVRLRSRPPGAVNGAALQKK